MKAKQTSPVPLIRLLCVLLSMLATACVLLLPPGAFAGTTTATLLEQARKRQAEVMSLEVKLKRSEDHAAGSSWLPPRPGGKRKPRPPTRTTLTSVDRLVVAGSNFRYESHPPSWDSGTGALLDQRLRIDVANGRESKTFFPKGLIGYSAGVGIIEQHGWHEFAKTLTLMPLMMTLRGAEPTLATYDLRLLKPGNVTLAIDGVMCSRFDLGSSPSALDTFWIDDTGLIRRRQFWKNGHLISQCDVRYECRYGVDDFPVSWVDVRYSPTGSVIIEDHVEVVDATVNATVSQTEFDVRFPPGTTVHENKQRGRHYLVQDDGNMREKDVEDGEGRSREAPGFLSRLLRLLGTGLAVLVLVLLGRYLLRRRFGWRF
jgi:hypothetical protein